MVVFKQIDKSLLINSDCLEAMDFLIQKGVKVDLILCDLPYGTTQNKWDTVIPFEPMWKFVWNIIKNNGAVLFFCDGLFMANLMLSDKNW